MLLGALTLPCAIFAADSAALFSLKGQVRVRKGESEATAAVGGELPGDALVFSGGASTVGIKLPDGTSVYLGAHTTVRFRFPGAPKKAEIILLKGVVSGDFATSDVLVRTSAGVVEPAGCVSQVVFTPNTVGRGVALVEVSTGVAKVTPLGSLRAVPVPAGNRISFGEGVSPVPSAMTKEQLDLMVAMTKGDFSGVIPPGAKSTAPTPNPLVVAPPAGDVGGSLTGGESDAPGAPGPAVTPVKATGPIGTNAHNVVPDVSIFSPNGEGALN